MKPENVPFVVIGLGMMAMVVLFAFCLFDLTPTQREAKAYFDTIKYRDVLIIKDDFRGNMECQITHKHKRVGTKYTLKANCRISVFEVQELIYQFESHELISEVKEMNK